MSKKKPTLAVLPRTGKTDSAPSTNGTTTKRAEYAQRGSGDTVQVTMRMKRDDWKRLHAVAMDENTSLQGLFLLAMSALLESKGQAGMEPLA